MREKEKEGLEKQAHETEKKKALLRGKTVWTQDLEVQEEWHNQVTEDSVEYRTTSEILRADPSASQLISMWPLALSTSYLHTAPSFLLEPRRVFPLYLSSWTHI